MHLALIGLKKHHSLFIVWWSVAYAREGCGGYYWIISYIYTLQSVCVKAFSETFQNKQKNDYKLSAAAVVTQLGSSVNHQSSRNRGNIHALRWLQLGEYAVDPLNFFKTFRLSDKKASPAYRQRQVELELEPAGSRGDILSE